MSAEAVTTVVGPSLDLLQRSEPLPFRALSASAMVAWAIGAAAAFHLAYEVFPPAILLFLVCIFQLSRTTTRPRAMYAGWLLGLCIYGPQLAFFYSIFGFAAVALWLVLATWLSVYLVLQRFALMKFGMKYGALAAPFIWTGVEYFRSELYYLRFSWLNIGYAMSSFPEAALLPWLGMYGTGFVSMALAATIPWFQSSTWRAKCIWTFTLALFLLAGQAMTHRQTSGAAGVGDLRVAGVQLEFADPQTILAELDKAVAKWPNAELLVLSEYTFDGKVPSRIAAWCKKHKKYLLAGGKEYLDSLERRFRNTAFVIGPEGQEVFSQAKMVPIQFFKDGLPALQQNLWHSPWGTIGFCVCYDLSYTRVTDELVRQGAQVIIAPTMDVQDWGARQHRLHARVAPIRAAEYGIPIFRLCSSGISQAVNGRGRVLASAAFPGQGEGIAATFQLVPATKHVPLDRYLVWLCVCACALLLTWYVVGSLWIRASSCRLLRR
ncbi:MAG TPA: nitrilase-related carbon-nitrogen hydrolase [Verrucomicrobiae bacterium]|nr:nitrilase-related carbon-nitrogen hydrolase [Verrucomicrobiae bacterium]